MVENSEVKIYVSEMSTNFKDSVIKIIKKLD